MQRFPTVRSNGILPQFWSQESPRRRLLLPVATICREDAVFVRVSKLIILVSHMSPPSEHKGTVEKYHV
jgi:hypothetical protein